MLNKLISLFFCFHILNSVFSFYNSGTGGPLIEILVLTLLLGFPNVPTLIAELFGQLVNNIFKDLWQGVRSISLFLFFFVYIKLFFFTYFVARFPQCPDFDSRAFWPTRE